MRPLRGAADGRLDQDVDWDVVAAEWAEREDAALTAAVRRRIGDDAVRAWQRTLDRRSGFLASSAGAPLDLDSLGQGRFTRRTDTFASTVTAGLDQLLAAADASPEPDALAVTVAYVYLEALIAWEYSDDPSGRITTLVAVLDRAVRALPLTPGADPTGLADLTDAARQLALALIPQLRSESALFCSCPIDLGRQTGRTSRQIAGARALLDEAAWTDPHPTARALGEVLRRDADVVGAYSGLLHDHVTPAVTAFVGWLENVDDPAAAPDQVGQALDDAIAACRRTEAAIEGDVLATEARSHRLSLDAMRSLLPQSRLRVESGELVLLYPFGLPGIDGADLVRSVLRSGEPGPAGPDRLGVESWTLLGLPAEAHDPRRTDSWSGVGSDGLLGHEHRNACLSFAEHSVRLTATEPRRYPDVRVELVVSSLGNHHVRISVPIGADTEVPAAVTADGADGWDGWSLGAPLPAADEWEVEEGQGWSAHELDQWVRRAGHEVGAELVELVDAAGRTEVAYASLIELSEHLLRLFVAQIEPGDGTADDLERSVDRLRGAVHVVIAASAVSEVLPSGEVVPVEHPARIPELVGATTLLLPRRSMPSSLEEWTRHRAPAPVNLLAGIGLEQDLVVRTADVTFMGMLGSPSWSAASCQEIVEFSASLAGVYEAWSVWLVAESHRIMTTRVTDDDDEYEDLLRRSTQLSEHVIDVRSLLDHYRSAQIVRTGNERALLDRLGEAGGLAAAERSLRETIDSMTEDQQLLTLRTGHIVEQARKSAAESEEWRTKAIVVATTILAVTGIADFWSWFNGGVDELLEAADGSGRFGVELTITVLTAVTLALLASGSSRRRRQRERRRGSAAGGEA